MEIEFVRRVPASGALFYRALYTIPPLIFVAMLALLFYLSFNYANSDIPDNGVLLPLIQITQWFDPVFFQYNLALLACSVAIIPLITLSYVHSMVDEKIRRLNHELPDEALSDQDIVTYINNYLSRSFDMRNYLGSMATLTIIVSLGFAIILLLKPMPLGITEIPGVDYTKGVNFMMLGPHMEHFMHNNVNEYMHVLITTLTAFQFGFLGAFVYFMGHLVRSYFTLDLTPNIFVGGSIRMMTGSILALVLSFCFINPNGVLKEMFFDNLPILSFFIGFFPSRGLALIENISMKSLGLMHLPRYASPLRDLPGISYAHQTRLTREGFDNIENLASASAIDLALRTGFSFQQLTKWISQAQLHGYLREDYHLFIDRTGINNLEDFISYWHSSIQADTGTDPASTLIAAIHIEEHSINGKIDILGSLLGTKTTIQNPFTPGVGGSRNTDNSENSV